MGRELLRAVMEHAARGGVRRLRLCTLPAMKAAQHLYAATGFTRTPDLDFEPAPGVALRAYELGLPPGVLPPASPLACILGGPGIPKSVPAYRGEMP